jgi:cytosine/adenosine deaminase-related metal-dependent hydrolase
MLLHAKWLAPMVGPLIPDGAVVAQAGRIVAIGHVEEIGRKYPDAIEHSYANAAILPGLINAHVHLELSDLSRPAQPETLADWLGDVVKQSPPPGEAGEQRVAQAIETGVQQCLRFGVTSIGDIGQRCALTRNLLRDGPLRVVSYGEVLAMAARRAMLEPRLAVAADQSERSEKLTIGISPHAPYSVEIPGYRRCLEEARKHALPIATHLAESAGEAEFLSNHTGPLRDLWQRIGGWDDAVPKFSGGPIRMAQSLGYLDYSKTLLAHVNHCDDDELTILAAGKASVVYCPRTHAYFGHPPHRWREMLQLGINVAIGTDSCASSPDLNLVDDLRLLHQLAPDMPPRQLWQLATTRASRAIAADPPAGQLTIGAVADFTIFRAASDDPLREILETDTLPISTWIAGTNENHSAFPRCQNRSI